MPKRKPQGNTRQIFASVREEIYLAAKARATELRMPLKDFVEMALEMALTGQDASSASPSSDPSIWDDEYLSMQAAQPVGSPVELSREEAERVVRAAFGSGPAIGPGQRGDGPDGDRNRDRESPDG